jgi:hypothetical protein
VLHRGYEKGWDSNGNLTRLTETESAWLRDEKKLLEVMISWYEVNKQVRVYLRQDDHYFRQK